MAAHVRGLPGEESRKMPQLITFRSQYWESREQMLQYASAAVWLAILTSSSTWNNNSHLERNIWHWLNALVLAHQEVIVVVFWSFFFLESLLWVSSVPPSQSKHLPCFHWEQGLKLRLNCIGDFVFRAVEVAPRSTGLKRNSHTEYNAVFSCT